MFEEHTLKRKRKKELSSLSTPAIDKLFVAAPTQPKAPKTKRPTGSTRTLRWILFFAQEGECHYCSNVTGFDEWTIDHKVPLSRGGNNHRPNKVGACNHCNHQKGSMTEEEFKTTPAHLRYKAHRKIYAMLRRGIKSFTLAEVQEVI